MVKVCQRGRSGQHNPAVAQENSPESSRPREEMPRISRRTSRVGFQMARPTRACIGAGVVWEKNCIPLDRRSTGR